jgi:enoyl-CoA hydratase
VEFFAHPWELGPRKAKELLFTSDWLSADEARQLGMVNQVVPRDRLPEAALAMATKIAGKSLFALKLIRSRIPTRSCSIGSSSLSRTRSVAPS